MALKPFTIPPGYLFLTAFLLLILLSLYLLFPFLVPLLAALVFAYLFYPIYKRLNRYVPSRALASILLILFITVIILAPFAFRSKALLHESIEFYQDLKSFDLSVTFPLLERLFSASPDLAADLERVLNRGVAFVIQEASAFALSLPQKVISLLIVIFVMYYLFKEGETISHRIKSLLPLHERQKEILTHSLGELVHAIMYGVIVTAFIQGLLGLLGFYLFSVSSPILWAGVMIPFAMLPYLGAAAVWLPIALLKLASGDFVNGLGLLVYGPLVLSLIDNLLKPRLISGRSRLHPVIVLFGVLGGLRAFGFIGIILGPVLLAITLLFMKFYLGEKE